nr:MAG TPA: Protein of unknown function (DUF1492) [Caudoviricetes sp.]
MKYTEFIEQTLNKVRSLCGEKEKLKRKREELRSKMWEIHSICYDDAKVSGGKKPDISILYERYQAQIEKQDKSIVRKAIKLSKAELKAERLINKISDPTQRKVLERYYINGESTKAIAKKMGYTQRRIQQLKREAIAAIAEEK